LSHGSHLGYLNIFFIDFLGRQEPVP